MDFKTLKKAALAALLISFANSQVVTLTGSTPYTSTSSSYTHPTVPTGSTYSAVNSQPTLPNNIIVGQQNYVHGDANQVNGDVNKLIGSWNGIQGSANLVVGN